MAKIQKLELTWPGKNSRTSPEPRILMEDKSRAYGEPDTENMLIHGDNLLALKSLEADFAGQVKCIYIDPPYNTGNAFEQYDDGYEHSIWLSLMRDRLEILRNLLSDDGVIFISIDDNELAYLMVLLDEIFGRKNSCGMFVWEKKKKPSFLDNNMGSITEYILAYSKNRQYSPPFIGGTTTEGKKYPINNAGNGLKTITFPAGTVEFKCKDQIFEPQDMSDGNIKTELLNTFEVKNGRNSDSFSLKGEWRYSQAKIDEIIQAGERIVISKPPFRPNHIKAGNEPKKIKNLLSIAHYEMSTYEDATNESRTLFGGTSAFGYPKPEKLIKTLLEAVTEEGDLVLDSFLGSGTTAAVAHKLKRRWIGIELGDHAYTHCQTRLQKVVDGTDTGGISKAVNWTGGGGFKFYELATSLLVEDEMGNLVIAKEYNADMLAEAMCKLMGYKYAPDKNTFWKQGKGTENNYIFTTTMVMTAPYLEEIARTLGNDSLMICCSAFIGDASAFPNITIKRIPKAVLDKCEWNKPGYPLPVRDDFVDEDFEFEE